MANQKLVIHRVPGSQVPGHWGESKEWRVGGNDLPIEAQIGRGRVVSHQLTPIGEGDYLVSLWVTTE